MRKRFDEVFRFGEGGVPRVWKTGDKIDELFKEAKTSATALLDTFGEASGLEGLFDNGAGVLLDGARREEAWSVFLRDADAAYREASAIVNAATIHTRVPFWLVLIAIVLGWNEIRAVLANPLLLFLLVLVGIAAAVLYQLGLWPYIVPFAKSKLRELIGAEPAVAASKKDD